MDAIASALKQIEAQAQERAADKPAKPKAELSVMDCNTPEQWAQWARERLEYEDPYGYERGRRW